jgi:enoyl-CoA hydratase/carnithine racemase
MNRAHQLNAINLDMLKDFETLFHALSRDDSISVLIITGTGRGYSSNIDINDTIANKEPEVLADPEKFMKIVQERYASLLLGKRRILPSQLYLP